MPVRLSGLKSNITLRSNLAPKGEDWRVDMLKDWHLVPGDLIEKWRTDFLGPRFDERSAMRLSPCGLSRPSEPYRSFNATQLSARA